MPPKEAKSRTGRNRSCDKLPRRSILIQRRLTVSARTRQTPSPPSTSSQQAACMHGVPITYLNNVKVIRERVRRRSGFHRVAYSQLALDQILVHRSEERRV